MIKSEKLRLGAGEKDGDEIFSHEFMAGKGIDKAFLLSKPATSLMKEKAPNESLPETTIEEPITQIFPRLSREELQAKFEAELGLIP